MVLAVDGDKVGVILGVGFPGSLGFFKHQNLKKSKKN